MKDITDKINKAMSKFLTDLEREGIDTDCVNIILQYSDGDTMFTCYTPTEGNNEEVKRMKKL